MRNKQGEEGRNERKREDQMGNSVARVTGREQMQSEDERRNGGGIRNDLIGSLNVAATEQTHKMNKKVGEQQVKVDCVISKISN